MTTSNRSLRGLTLIEAMLLLVIMSIIAVAAGVGLQAVAKVPAKTDDMMAINNVLVSVMEQTRANMIKNWPSADINGSNYAFTITTNSFTAGYTPASTTVGTTTGSVSTTTGAPLGSPGTAYSTPTSGTWMSVNNKSYKLSLWVNQADPAGASSYQTDYMQICVSVYASVSGAAQTAPAQTMVCYVTKP